MKSVLGGLLSFAVVMILLVLGLSDLSKVLSGSEPLISSYVMEDRMT
jgi:hypothetical protein